MAMATGGSTDGGGEWVLGVARARIVAVVVALAGAVRGGFRVVGAWATVGTVGTVSGGSLGRAVGILRGLGLAYVRGGGRGLNPGQPLSETEPLPGW